MGAVETETVGVETAVQMMVVHLVEIEVHVRKETARRETEVHVRRVIDPSVHRESVHHVRQETEVHVRRVETEVHARRVIDPSVHRESVHKVSVSPVLSRHLQHRRQWLMRLHRRNNLLLHRRRHQPHQHRMLVLLRASRGVRSNVIGTVTYKISPTASWSYER
ncbi:MAG: hypothetical protein NVS4B1_31660 [Ktedonobacteraceae bacterium]